MDYDHLKTRLPLSLSSFEELRRLGKIYVDKTDRVYSMACQNGKFFLARPRRFGKSLLVSTFESLFRHGLRDFQGLAIERKWQDQPGYTVLRLDFSRVKRFSSIEDFRLRFRAYLKGIFLTSEHPLAEETGVIATDFEIWLQQFRTSSVVLLIDEYDAPLTACLANPGLFESVRNELSDFYAVIKSNDGLFRFVFMTGITKFNQTGIFSELNHLDDISLDKPYAALLGYTSEELKKYFAPFLEYAADALHLSRSELLTSLEAHYDGYCFDGLSEEGPVEKVFTPWSVLNFFSRPQKGFENYWIESGGKPQVLLQYLQGHSLQSPSAYAQEKMLDLADLKGASNLDSINDVALLTQAGYLTIKRREGDLVWVDYPNREVAVSMADLYTRFLLNEKTLGTSGAPYVARALCSGDAELAVEQFNKAFLSINYQRFPIVCEASCQAALQILITGAGIEAQAERHNAHGRSDLELDAGQWHWVIELKFLPANESEAASRQLLEAAIRQMRTRHYGESSQGRLLRLALVYGEKDRRFMAWSAA